MNALFESFLAFVRDSWVSEESSEIAISPNSIGSSYWITMAKFFPCFVMMTGSRGIVFMSRPKLFWASTEVIVCICEIYYVAIISIIATLQVFMVFLSLIYQVYHQFYHHLFLLRITLSNEESKNRESSIIDFDFTIFLESVTVLLKEPDKEKCTNTLVAIGEWMILDDEIEKVCCLFFDCWIEIIPIECCNNIRENSHEALIFLISEDIVRLTLFEEFILEFTDGGFRLSIIDDIGNVFISAILHIPCIIAVQEKKTLSIIRDDIEESFCFICIDFLSLCREELDSPTEFVETRLIDRVSLDEVFLESGGCPDTKSCTTLRIHTVTHRDYHVEIIVVCRLGEAIFGISGFTECLIFHELFRLVNIPHMFIYCSLRFIKKLSHLCLSQPNCIILHFHSYFCCVIRRCIDDDIVLVFHDERLHMHTIYTYV